MFWITLLFLGLMVAAWRFAYTLNDPVARVLGIFVSVACLIGSFAIAPLLIKSVLFLALLIKPVIPPTRYSHY